MCSNYGILDVHYGILGGCWELLCSYYGVLGGLWEILVGC